MSGQVDYDRESVKCGYDAYRRACETHPALNQRLPEWDDLAPEMQAAWIVVSQAIRQKETERTTQY